MAETLGPATASDEALLDLVRTGDTGAWAELFRRHHDAATRMARGLDPSNADDLVSEAFTRVYVAARNGAGVRSAFRPYLFQAIRNLAVNRFQRDRRLMWVEEMPDQGPHTAAPGEFDDRIASEVLADAFRSLPPRWQAVLWHTAVEGEDHQVVGQIMGLKPNAVAALSYRAREGLRRAYVDAHVAETDVFACQEVRRLVPGHVLGKLSAREDERLASHLDGCAACAAVVLEVVSVNGRPGTALLPAIVGPVLAAGYVAEGGGAATLADDPSPLFASGGSHHGALAAAGTTLVLLLGAVGIHLALQSDPTSDRPTSKEPASAVITSSEHTMPTTATPSSSAPSATPSARAPETAPSSAEVFTPVPDDELPAPAPISPTAGDIPPPLASVPRTRYDLSIVGGAVTVYPDHQHLQLDLGPESDAAGTQLTYQVDGLESFTAHRRGQFRPGSCELTAAGGADRPSEVTCTLGAGAADFAIDMVVTGDLVVSVTLSAPHNTDPAPGNNTWRTP